MAREGVFEQFQRGLQRFAGVRVSVPSEPAGTVPPQEKIRILEKTSFEYDLKYNIEFGGKVRVCSRASITGEEKFEGRWTKSGSNNDRSWVGLSRSGKVLKALLADGADSYLSWGGKLADACVKETKEKGLNVASLRRAAEVVAAEMSKTRQEENGSTFTGVKINPEGSAGFLHLGDSAGFLFSDDTLEQVTEEHDELADTARKLMRERGLNKETAEKLAKEMGAKGNRLTRAVKIIDDEPIIDMPQILNRDLLPGNVLLLASDGLTKYLTGKEIERIIRNALMEGKQDEISSRLVSQAYDMAIRNRDYVGRKIDAITAAAVVW